MEDIDLLNMLRHAYLFGINDGVYATRKDHKRPDLHFDSEEERDEALQSLIEDLKRQGGESYNQYCGSNCEENCTSWEDALDEMIPG